jgi:hypothetical protein
MKRNRCPVCKTLFAPTKQGRPQRYCSASCRQKAYITRKAKPTVLKLWEADYREHRIQYRRNTPLKSFDAFIQDREAQRNYHLNALKKLGYEYKAKKGHREESGEDTVDLATSRKDY